MRARHLGPALAMLAFILAGEPAVPQVPSVGPGPADGATLGKRFVPAEADLAHPVYETSFDDPAVLRDWRLEGGRRMSVSGGNLVLESEGEMNHLVCWLTKEVPADFLLEFTVRPRNRREGLNIVFFNARGLKGESIFDPALAKRDGKYPQYHSGDLNAYHVSYWAAGRGTANMRKSRGFHLVAEGKDLVYDGPPGAFQTVRIYKRGARVRVMVDDVVALAHDDDGRSHGPAHTHSGWIGLHQMGHTQRCEYGHVKVYPLRP